MLRGVPLSLIISVWVICAPVWAQSLTLQWDPSVSSDVVGYRLYRSETSGVFTGSPVNASLIQGTSYTDTTLHYDSTYYYVCTAVNQAGLESAPSNQVRE